MPKFSSRSFRKLRTCVSDLQILFNEVVENYDCTVIWGYRNEKEQNDAYAKGNSKLKFPFSKHNTLPSYAVDVAPFVNGSISWNTKQCYHFAGYVLGVWNMLKKQGKVSGDLCLGADWDRDYDVNDQKFNDLVHFEIATDKLK